MHESIFQKCDRLERRLDRITRLHRFGGCAIASLAAIAIITGVANKEQTKTLRAQRILIHDADGKVRAELGVDDRNNVVFFQHDAQGNTCLSQGVTANGRPTLALTQSSDDRQISLAFTPLGDGGITLRDANLTPRGRFFTTRDGTPTIQIRDETNQTIFTAP